MKRYFSSNKQKYGLKLRFFRAYRYFFIVLLLITAVFKGNAQGAQEDSTLQAAQPAEKPMERSLLDSRVQYRAKDSILFDLIEQKVYLYGNGEVSYENINLKAAYIELDLKRKTVHAKTGVDSLGRPAGRPLITESGQSSEAQEMWYNFETKKGRMSDVRTHEGDSYVIFDTAVKDSNDVYYGRSGKYTTCNLDHPHYAIHAGKLKVIPNDKIVTGPAYLEVADVPTPLGIPFGFFPNKKGQASGIIPPQYGESRDLGFFLRDGGYYFGFNDTIDLALRADVYSYGSWAVDAETNYNIRYKFNGRVSLSYANTLFDDPELETTAPRRDIFIKWNHNQDPKRNPNSRFSANVNAGSSTYNRLYSYNTYNYLNNQLYSNISYTRTFPGRDRLPGSSLSLNARHNQNTATRQMRITAPELTYNINRFYPSRIIRDKNKLVTSAFGKTLDKIGVSYIINANNEIDTQDSILFDLKKYNLDLDDVSRYGVKHTMPLVATFPVGRYINATLSASASQTLFFKTRELFYDPSEINTVTPYDTIITPGLRSAEEYSASAQFLTRLYGQTNFRRSFLGMTAIRHVMTPSFGASVRPDYTDRYYKTVQLNSPANTVTYSVFEGGTFGVPPQGKSGLLTWSLNNNVEAKVRDNTDTAGAVTRKVTIIESFVVSGNYNWAIEEFQWSTINFAGRTKLFKRVDINASGSFDPYAVDAMGSGRRIERFEWNVNRNLARLTAVNLAIGTSLQSKKKDDKPKESAKATPQELEFINRNPDAFVDFNVPWTLSVNYTIRYLKPLLESDITQGIGVRGDFSLTPKWKIGFDSNYDFEVGDFTYNSINIYRDLHCWEMVFNWIPFGPRQSYTLDIRVKSPVLSDLKLTRRRDWYDYR